MSAPPVTAEHPREAWDEQRGRRLLTPRILDGS